ncbi:MAG: hypothetical protein AAGF85_18950 [Bacteroidota bacterium]
MKVLLKSISIILMVQSAAFAQTITSNWQNKLETALSDFKSCMAQNDNISCKSAVGESIKSIYNINDFYNNGHATAMEIANAIDNKTTWKKLGQAYNQEVLTQAQELANSKKPVLAVYKGEDGITAHVVMILPGELQPSGSWNLRVPTVASFFTHEPEKSFVDKSLAYAFSKTMLLRIELYARN